MGIFMGYVSFREGILEINQILNILNNTKIYLIMLCIHMYPSNENKIK